MAGDLRDLHELAVGGLARDDEPALGQAAFVLLVELVAVAMALADPRWCRRSSPRSEPGGEHARRRPRAAWCRPSRPRPAGPAACRSPGARRPGRPRSSWRPRGRRRCARTRSPPSGSRSRCRRRACRCARAYSRGRDHALRCPGLPKPPGTRMPSTPAEQRFASPASSSSDSTQRRTTRTSLAKPPWERASFRLL